MSLPSDVEEWLQGNTSSGTAQYLRSTREQRRARLSELAISESSPLAQFYLAHHPDSVRGWYELATLDDIPSYTAYAHEELGVPSHYVALSGVEGEGIILYNTRSGEVFDVEFGQFEALEAGTLMPKGATFVDFLRWCRGQSQDA